MEKVDCKIAKMELAINRRVLRTIAPAPRFRPYSYLPF